jgi:hypothetical protein
MNADNEAAGSVRMLTIAELTASQSAAAGSVAQAAAAP